MGAASQIADLLSRLKAVLGPTRYRIARLRYGHGLSQRQIARRVRKSQPAVHKHLAAIRRAYPAAAFRLA